MGPAREAIIDLLAGQGCALSAGEVQEAMRGAPRPVGRASAFRILDQLEELGLVRRLDLGDGMARYETIDPSGDHHHHLVCDRCGRVVPFEDAELERSIRRVSSRMERFAVQTHDVTLRGACGACCPPPDPAPR
jgi:Fur family ferric uptake transcriptional regulator